ncbi:DNA repair exonuclease [Thermococcus sp. 21S9]|uniref:DNA repair exonuclease n=1 Tax=Thermococcus sp. 21S9 TaxID=1638223 RepID=UPI00143C8FBE|nr:exonuclease SbcCD subunit D [Thermococcus sp. 21S9]NJE55395.1 exonuclease SbcCD subunit D [Thermococcus sp. 21S9]
MRFAHIADVHLGREQFNQPFRYEDYVGAFREAVEKAVKAGVDFILIAGDLFHVSRPSPKALRDAVEILEIPRRREIPVFAIEGNHDKTIREASVFDLLEHLGLLRTLGLRREEKRDEFLRSKRIADRYLVWAEVDGFKIYGLRHHTRWQLIRGNTNVLKALFKKGDILMLHQAVDYLAKDTPYQDAFDLKLSELPENFSYYALGHIHVRKVAEPEQTGLNGPIVYPGSLERTDVREASHVIVYGEKDRKPKVRENNQPKGFYIVEDFKPEFIEVETRPFYRVTISGNSKAELRRRVEEVAELIPKDAVAIIYLEGTVKGGVSLAEFNDLLKDFGIAYYAFRSRVTSEAIISRERVSEEILTEWERELFLHMRSEPKEFPLDEFMDWLLEKYRLGVPAEMSARARKPAEEPKKPENVEKKPPKEKKHVKVTPRREKQEKPKPEKKTGKKPKPAKPSSLDAWLRGGKL